MATDIGVSFAKTQALPADPVEGRLQIVDDTSTEAYVGTETDWKKITDTAKADKVAGATAGDLASLDASGNVVDSGFKASDVITDANIIVIDEPVTDGTFQLIATRTSGTVTYSFEPTT